MAQADEEERPAGPVVEKFHTNCDVDESKEAYHHTIGTNTFQAASGAHTHNGSDSPQLLINIEITGSRGGNTALASVIAALVFLGAKDSTTA
jgi:hypothetical protein